MRSLTKHSLMLSHVNSVRVNLYLMVRVGIFAVGLLCDAYVRIVERGGMRARITPKGPRIPIIGSL